MAAAVQAGQYGHNTETEYFEAELAAFLGVPDVVTVNSGTAALHLSLLLAGIGPDDEVVVPSQTFCATIRKALTPRTRAVLPVLYGGRAVDLRDVHDELTDRGITVIEDAAHAFGSRLGSELVGSTGAALTCFSFGPIKNLTCIEGGALIPRHPTEAARAQCDS